MIGFDLRFHRQVRRVRRAIARRVGTVELVRSVWGSQAWRHSGRLEWRRAPRTRRGVLRELGAHHVDLRRFLLESEVDGVFASARTEGNADQTATLTARLQNGAVAVSGFWQCAAEAHEIGRPVDVGRPRPPKAGAEAPSG